jgi:hypothetical protein
MTGLADALVDKMADHVVCFSVSFCSLSTRDVQELASKCKECSRLKILAIQVLKYFILINKCTEKNTRKHRTHTHIQYPSHTHLTLLLPTDKIYLNFINEIEHRFIGICIELIIA